MANNSVSLAIDHGTSNSCVAVMSSTGPRVISAEAHSAILPSAVFYDARGALQVGSSARRLMRSAESHEGQGFTGYKLHIGSDRRYEFTAARKSLSAPELGAIVIQTLLRAHQRESGGTDARACVITIPAKFAQNAVEGTRAAAAMAGLKYHPLIMEPVAAAMRYGFDGRDLRAQWLVFDLGGGTLDVSLLIVRNGKLVVPDGGHAGDDRLGGMKFDQDLTGYVLQQLEKTHPLSTFRRQRDRYGNEWGRLLLAVEEAKIKLSAQPEAVVELDLPLCRDDRGQDVEVRVPVTRTGYEDLIRPDIERAAQICLTLLKSNRLSPKQIAKLILVGGPSKTPLVQRILQERLGISLASSIDPMTAVAEGAAIYADTIELPPEHRGPAKARAGSYAIRIEAERHSTESTYCAVGVVDGPTLDGLRIQVERLDGEWKSRELPLDGSGVFAADLFLIQAEKPTLSQFRTTLLDRQGRILTSVDDPQIWFPYPAVENRLANSLRVGIASDRTEPLIRQGTELPAEGSHDFVTVKALRKGSSDDVLRIPVLESVTNLLGHEDDGASCSLHVGTLRIHGSDHRITQDVPGGADLEVQLKVDESRNITAIARIDMLDGAEFETTFHGETFQYDLADLRQRREQLDFNLERVRAVQRERPVPEVQDALDILERTALATGIATDLERASEGDQDAEVRGYKRLLEAEGTVHELERLQRRPRITLVLSRLKPVVPADQQYLLKDLESDYAAAQDDKGLAACLKSAEQMEFVVRGRPWGDLWLDLMALSGLTVSLHQHELFNTGSALLDRIEAKGGVDEASDADIAEMTAAHRRLEEAHPDLYELRQKKLDELGVKSVDQLRGSDIDLARR